MQGDVTRSTFDPKKGYTSVRMQQGRLQLDSDWNEQADIQNYLRRAQVTDMIGSGSGASKVDPFTGKPSTTGFQLRLIEAATSLDASAEATDIAVLPGHFYTNGVLCELAPGSTFTVTPVETNQPNGPSPNEANQLQVSPSLTMDGRRLQEGDWLVLAGEVGENPVKDEAGNLSRAETEEPSEPAIETSSEPTAEEPSEPTAEEPSEPTAENSFEPAVEAPSKPVAKKESFPVIKGWRISRIVDESNRIIEVIGDLSQLRSPITVQRIVTYTSQPDWPVEFPSNTANPISEETGPYFAYLDVWQRHITAVDDPAIREVALSVPDTTTRTKTVWQLKLKSFQEKTESPSNEWGKFLETQQHRNPQLNACARLCPGTSSNGATAANGRLGNFLYRVEIHDGNDPESSNSSNTVTFKWSRNNGSSVSPVQKIDGNVIRIAKASQNAWADSRPGQWLELLTEAQELRGEPGILVPLKSAIDTRLEFDAARIIGGAIPVNVTKVRRWDHTVVDAPQGAIPIQSEWVELENGIKVTFKVSDAESQVFYRTGDYWLIPSRAATNDIEWPTDRADDDVSNKVTLVSKPLFQPPNGVDHLYALLGIVEIDNNKRVAEVEDQRVLFPPLLRALDTAGGTITGSLVVEENLTVKKTLEATTGIITGNLAVQKNLKVDDTLTTKNLEVEDNFAVDTLRSENYEILLNPTSENPINYGVIKANAASESRQIEFVSEPNTNFVFLKGDVFIGQPDNGQNLNVAGRIDGQEIFQNESAVALKPNLDAHIEATNNPHKVTATQIDNENGDNRIVARINEGTGIIDAERINRAIARASDLSSHTENRENPHQVTATQIDNEGGQNRIVARINESTGIIDAERINRAIARASDLSSHTENRENPHQVTATQIDGDDNQLIKRINDAPNNDQRINLNRINVDNIQERANEIAERVSTVEEQVTTLQGQVNGVPERVSTVEEQVTTLQEQVNGVPERVGTTENQVAEVAERVSTVEEQVTTLQGQVNEIPQRVGTAENQVTTLQERVETVEEQVTTLQGQVEMINTNLGNPSLIVDAAENIVFETITTRSLAVTPGTSVGGESEPYPFEIRVQDEGSESVLTVPDVLTPIEDGLPPIGIAAIPQQIEFVAGDNTDFTFLNGRVGIGSSVPLDLAPEAKLYVNGNLYVDTDSDSSEDPSILASGGAIFAKNVETENVTSNRFTQLSSIARKEDVAKLSSQEVSEALGKLNPVTFRYKEDKNHSLYAGFLAEEVPELFSTSDRQGVKLMDIIAILTKAVQDNRIKLIQLDQKIAQRDDEILKLKKVVIQQRMQIEDLRKSEL